MKKTAFMVLISALFMIGCGGDGGSSSASTSTADNLTMTIDFNADSASVVQDCAGRIVTTASLTGDFANYELKNCLIEILYFHADNTVLTLSGTTSVTTYDFLGTGDTLRASQAILDTVDEPTLTEIAI